MFSRFPMWWFFGFMVFSMVVRFVTGIFRIQKVASQASGTAKNLGFTFTPWTNDPRVSPQVDTELFRKDNLKTFRNLMTGTYAGMETKVFDYSCSSGNVQNPSTWTQTVAVYSKDVDLPLFTLQPESIMLKLLDALQHQRVNLDYPAGASHHYALHGPDKDRIKPLFTQNVVSFLESLDRSKEWIIEGSGKQLVIYRYAHRVKADDLQDFLQETSSIAQSLFGLLAAKAAHSSGV